MFNSLTLDRFAILLSGVCLVHCLIAPIVITLLPIFSLNTFVGELLFHNLMLWLILPTSILALFIGCRKHRRWSIACTAALGILILVAVAYFGHDWFGLLGEKIATTVAGIILALSHYLNFRACQSISCSDKNCASKHHH